MGAAAIGNLFTQTLERKRTEAEWLATREATSVPDSSGISKQMGFIEGKSPRLALAASELETAQNSCIRWLEMRANRNAKPGGMVSWTKVFDLTDTMESIKAVFSLQKLVGVRSTTLESKGMMRAVKESGLATDDKDLKKIEAEYGESSAESQSREAQQKDAAAAFGLGR